MEYILLILRFAAIAVFAGALLWAAVSDLRTFEVPNAVPVAVLLAFPVLALGTGAGWGTLLNGVLTGVGVLVVGFGLFAVRALGAGDVKTVAAVSLWIGWPELVPYLFSVVLCGGALALALVLFRRGALPDRLRGIGWVHTLHGRKKDVPYAVAIALPALFHLPRLVQT